MSALADAGAVTAALTEPEPEDGRCCVVLVTAGGRRNLTGATLLTREQAEAEAARWGRRYGAAVGVVSEVTGDKELRE